MSKSAKILINGTLLLLLTIVSKAELVAYWNFNEIPQSSTYLIDLAGDCDGVLMNGAEYVISQAGQISQGMGNAASFDDIDDLFLEMLFNFVVFFVPVICKFFG